MTRSPDDRDSGLLLIWRDVSVDVGLDPDDLEYCDLTWPLDCFSGDLLPLPLSLTLTCNIESSSTDVFLMVGGEAGATLVMARPVQQQWRLNHNTDTIEHLSLNYFS